jgi:hypothetical protein
MTAADDEVAGAVEGLHSLYVMRNVSVQSGGHFAGKREGDDQQRV